MKACIIWYFLFAFSSSYGQNNSIDNFVRYSIDTVIRENKNYADKYKILEVKAYYHSEEKPQDSILCLIEKYDSAGRIQYKKDFHYYDKKAYEEFIYFYDSLGRLKRFTQQNTYQAPSYEETFIDYSKNRVSQLICRDTLKFEYYDNGKLKKVNGIEYFYNKNGNLSYKIENRDTISTNYYDSNNCLTEYSEYKDYATLTNDKDCNTVELKVYTNRKKTENSLSYKTSMKFENGKPIEKIIITSFRRKKMQPWKHEVLKYNEKGLLTSVIELVQFGKKPRITNYYYIFR